MGVFDLLGLQPFDEKREVIRNFFSVKNSIDHMTAEKSHLYFVSSMWIDFVVLMDGLEDVGSGRAI